LQEIAFFYLYGVWRNLAKNSNSIAVKQSDWRALFSLLFSS